MRTWTRQSAPGWWTTNFEISTSYEGLLEDAGEIPGVIIHVQSTVHGCFRGTAQAHVSAIPALDAFNRRILQEFPVRHPVVYEPAPGLPTRELRSYQRDAAAWLCAKGGGLLCDEMGLGKTSAAIAATRLLRGHTDKTAAVLIVGPKFTGAVWKRELQAVGACTLPEQFFAASGSAPTPEQERAMAAAPWWFCHYEILDAWRAAFTQPLYTRRPVVMIFDEAHWLRNPKSTRTKAALAVGPLAKHRIALTGTPIANEVRDLWPLLSLVSGRGAWGTPFEFLKRYTHYEKGAYGFVSTGTRNMDELQGRLDEVYLRRTHEDVGSEIPSLTRSVVRVQPQLPLTAELKRWAGADVGKALDRLRLALRSGKLGADTITTLSMWRKWTTKAKIPSTVDLATSLLAEGENVVIFAWMRETVDLLEREICKVLRSKKDPVHAVVHTVHGGKTQEQRDAIVESFQTKQRNPTALIATTDSLKEGVTLHAARSIILHDLDWVPSVVLQIEARVHRLGQTRPCIAYWTVAEMSADELIIEHLTEKAGTIEAALGDTKATEALAETVGGTTGEDMGARFAADILEDM